MCQHLKTVFFRWLLVFIGLGLYTSFVFLFWGVWSDWGSGSLSLVWVEERYEFTEWHARVAATGARGALVDAGFGEGAGPGDAEVEDAGRGAGEAREPEGEEAEDDVEQF